MLRINPRELSGLLTLAVITFSSLLVWKQVFSVLSLNQQDKFGNSIFAATIFTTIGLFGSNQVVFVISNIDSKSAVIFMKKCLLVASFGTITVSILLNSVFKSFFKITDNTLFLFILTFALFRAISLVLEMSIFSLSDNLLMALGPLASVIMKVFLIFFFELQTAKLIIGAFAFSEIFSCIVQIFILRNIQANRKLIAEAVFKLKGKSLMLAIYVAGICYVLPISSGPLYFKSILGEGELAALSFTFLILGTISLFPQVFANASLVENSSNYRGNLEFKTLVKKILYVSFFIVITLYALILSTDILPSNVNRILLQIGFIIPISALNSAFYSYFKKHNYPFALATISFLGLTIFSIICFALKDIQYKDGLQISYCIAQLFSLLINLIVKRRMHPTVHEQILIR